jgi:plasmid maintenance system antidote protein VapI
MNIDKRLKILIEELGINQSRLGKIIGVQRQNISAIVNGKSNLQIEHLLKIKEAYPLVNIHWLLFEQGEPMIKIEDMVKQTETLSTDKIVELLKSQIELLQDETIHHRKQVDLLNDLLRCKIIQSQTDKTDNA